ncbi:inositol 2-dehydrogenase [Tessaracoccus antarcticus]|uniref:Inositol 2-dehydrogenase n=1 Tax=Tessaracoccus antarcticus TaxID=2479848 RepID=A0A3M0GBB0_9ACTN|nr:inositol 2-dehydrogenase [Tessaracoccus antarcticus]RMB61627.1 inositol 2-dehydrogenase [Tessaracoccus antarcticus]
MTRIAIIGAGRIGQVHARAVLAHPQAELALVCDPFEANARSLAEAHGVAWCLDAAEVFASDDVDAVIIGSPTRFHVDHILAAVAAGKKVLCEKPVALELSEAERCLRELGENTDVMMGFNRRFDPTFSEIHHRVADGEIGDVQQLIVVSRDPAAPPAEYVAGSGGIFKDMTIHDFDMVRFFLGDIVEVVAIGTNVDEAIAAQGDFDQVIVTLKSAEGRMATIINSRTCSFGYDQRLEAFGSEGTLSADNLTATAVRKASGNQTEAKSRVMDFFLDRYVDAYRLELDAFLTAVADGSPMSPSVRDGYEALRLADAATISAHEGRIVSL